MGWHLLYQLTVLHDLRAARRGEVEAKRKAMEVRLAAEKADALTWCRDNGKAVTLYHGR